MRLTKSLATVLCGALLLTACQTSRPPQRPPAPTLPPVVVPSAALATADYFALAASIDLFEVRSGELAQSRASDSSLRGFGAAMAAAHGGTAAQLSFAGRRLGLLPSTALLPAQQDLLDQLEGSADFDATYRRQQRALHQRAVRLHEGYAARGASATLRPVAASAARIERAHLARIGVL